jgi:hypothetical protein
MRKVIKASGHFPNDQAALEPPQSWNIDLNRSAIMFEGAA